MQNKVIKWARLDSLRRDVEKEKQIEREVSRILRERFTFSLVELEGHERRMGSQGLEALLIGPSSLIVISTVAAFENLHYLLCNFLSVASIVRNRKMATEYARKN